MSRSNGSDFDISYGCFWCNGGGLVAPALPVIGEAFTVSEEKLGLILSVYTILAALSLPLLGYLIDTLGRRKIALATLAFLWSLSVFYLGG